MPFRGEVCEERRIDQERFITNETGPGARVAIGITAEIEAAEDADQRFSFWYISAAAPQQLHAGVPVVVPNPFCFQCVDLLGGRPQAAVVVHGFLEGSAIAAGHVPDHTVDIEQINGEAQVMEGIRRLVG